MITIKRLPDSTLRQFLIMPAFKTALCGAISIILEISKTMTIIFNFISSTLTRLTLILSQEIVPIFSTISTVRQYFTRSMTFGGIAEELVQTIMSQTDGRTGLGIRPRAFKAFWGKTGWFFRGIILMDSTLIQLSLETMNGWITEVGQVQTAPNWWLPMKPHLRRQHRQA